QNCSGDNEPPVALLKSELTVYNNAATASTFGLFAGLFDAGSFDNCTKQKDLRFSFSPDPDEWYKPLQEIGEGELEIWVTDKEGNQTSVVTQLIINQETCEEDFTPPVVYYPNYITYPSSGPEESYDFNIGTFSFYAVDNCTELLNLTFSYEKDEIVGQKQLPNTPGSETTFDIWVTDKAGNQSSFTVNWVIEGNEIIPVAPINLRELEKSTNQVTLKWSPIENLEKYIIQGRKKGSEKWQLFQKITGNSFTVKRRFIPGVIYEWRVKGNYRQLDAPFSEIKTFTIDDDAHGILEDRGEAVFGSLSRTKIYPSPASHTLTVESLYEIEQIEIFDLTGKRLRSVTPSVNQSVQLDVSQLPNGQYLIRLTSNDKVETLQFTKQ
ncbi:MAG: T9SS type A sorting domain-containing protein, partial [Bacteroidota bacterium]